MKRWKIYPDTQKTSGHDTTTPDLTMVEPKLTELNVCGTCMLTVGNFAIQVAIWLTHSDLDVQPVVNGRLQM